MSSLSHLLASLCSRNPSAIVKKRAMRSLSYINSDSERLLQVMDPRFQRSSMAKVVRRPRTTTSCRQTAACMSARQVALTLPLGSCGRPAARARRARPTCRRLGASRTRPGCSSTFERRRPMTTWPLSRRARRPSCALRSFARRPLQWYEQLQRRVGRARRPRFFFAGLPPHACQLEHALPP